MVIRVQRQAHHRVARQQAVGVPRLGVPHARRRAPEPPVLEVVDGLEQRDRGDRLADEGDERGEAEAGADRDEQRELDRRADEHLSPIDPPRAAQLADDRAAQERQQALAEARRRRIVGRRDAHVVAAYVLDVEVIVERRPQERASEPARHAATAMDQLVRDDHRAPAGVVADELDEDRHVPAEAGDRHGAQRQRDGRQLDRDERVEDRVERPAGRGDRRLVRGTPIDGEQERQRQQDRRAGRAVRSRGHEPQRRQRQHQGGGVGEPEARHRDGRRIVRLHGRSHIRSGMRG